jgi:hemolysin III
MRIREPVNAWSHLVGLVLATAGTAVLLRLAHSHAQTVAFAVYGGSLVLLYAASTLYHALPLPPHRLRPLRTLDHIAIYFLIAGTYTPVALVTLHGPWGWALLAAAWAIAIAGIPFKIWWLDAPIWLSTATYLAMGYMALLAAAPRAAAVWLGGVVWLVGGGVA